MKCAAGLAAAGLLTLAFHSSAAEAASSCDFDPGRITRPGPDAITVLFDSFAATPGEDVRCDLSILTERSAAEGTFLVYSADYRGFVNGGDTARLTVSQERVAETATVRGPVDGVLLHSYIGAGGTDTLDSTALLQLARTEDPDSFASIDSIDYALAAATTAGEIEASLDGLGSARTSVLVQLQPVAGLLTGIDRAVERPDEVSLLGAAGSYLAGLTAHRSLGDTVSLDGGVGLFEQSADGADAKGAMAAVNLRTLAPGQGAWRPFAEGGASASSLRLRFARGYDEDLSGGATGTGSTGGFGAGIHGSLGFLVRPDAANQIVLSATAAQDWLRTGGYAEGFDGDNLFSAAYGRETTGLTTLKVGAAWTAAFTPALDMTLNAAVGHGRASGAVEADVSFAGAFAGDAQDDDFLEYGGRFGFKPAPSFSADVFAQGATGRAAGTHVFWGGSAGYRF